MVRHLVDIVRLLRNHREVERLLTSLNSKLAGSHRGLGRCPTSRELSREEDALQKTALRYPHSSKVESERVASSISTLGADPLLLSCLTVARRRYRGGEIGRDCDIDCVNY